jgi:hypothetical protein
MKKGLIASFMVALMLITVCSTVVTANAVTVNKETTSTVSESSTKGFYIEITRIVPHIWYLTFDFPILCFVPELTNTGDEPFGGDIGFSAKAYDIYGKVYDSITQNYLGGLNPGESWLNTDKGYGLWFYGDFIPAKYYRLEFYSIPSNDYKMAKYKIYGDGFFIEYQAEEVTDSFLDIFSRTIVNPFILERFPMLNLLLQRLRCMFLMF